MTSYVSFSIAAPSTTLFREHAKELSELLFSEVRTSNPQPSIHTLAGATISRTPYNGTNEGILYWLRNGHLQELRGFEDREHRVRAAMGVTAGPTRVHRPEEGIIVGHYDNRYINELVADPAKTMRQLMVVAKAKSAGTYLDGPLGITVQELVPLNASELYFAAGPEQLWITTHRVALADRFQPETAARARIALQAEAKGD